MAAVVPDEPKKARRGLTTPRFWISQSSGQPGRAKRLICRLSVLGDRVGSLGMIG